MPSQLDSGGLSCEEVLRIYHRTGKHGAPSVLRSRLVRARAQLSHATPVRTFLDIALDQHDGTFDYNSYLALDLLPLPSATDDAADARLRHDRLVAALVRDTLVFEAEAAEGATPVLPEHRPPPSVMLKRLRHGNSRLLTLSRRLELSAAEQWALRFSVVPVGRAHDEYVLIRMLQAFETSLALIAVELTAAGEAFRRGAPAGAARHIEVAESTLATTAPLFALLSTARAESFQDFHQYAEGASAGQSRHGRLVASLCRSAGSSGAAPRLRGFRMAWARWQSHYWHVLRGLGYPLGRPYGEKPAVPVARP